MNYPQARNLDITSHGGILLNGSFNTVCSGFRNFIRTNLSTHICPIHGINIVITGSLINKDNMGLNDSRIMDRCACGAIIITGEIKLLIGDIIVNTENNIQNIINNKVQGVI